MSYYLTKDSASKLLKRFSQQIASNFDGSLFSEMTDEHFKEVAPMIADRIKLRKLQGPAKPLEKVNLAIVQFHNKTRLKVCFSAKLYSWLFNVVICVRCLSVCPPPPYLCLSHIRLNIKMSTGLVGKWFKSSEHCLETDCDFSITLISISMSSKIVIQ